MRMTATQKAGQSERKYPDRGHHQVRTARSRRMQQFFYFFIRWMRTTTCDAKELHHFRFVPNAQGRTITLISGNISGCQTAVASRKQHHHIHVHEVDECARGAVPDFPWARIASTPCPGHEPARAENPTRICCVRTPDLPKLILSASHSATVAADDGSLTWLCRCEIRQSAVTPNCVWS